MNVSPFVEASVGNLKLAAETGHYTGLVDDAPAARYMRRCTAVVPVGLGRGARIIFTRDIGHHSSGWFKNPDYERCYHLSLSFTEDGFNAPFDRRTAWELATLFFRDEARKVWIEPPYTAAGRLAGVHHYRLFCDAGWQAIVPRGEAYTKDFTEKGWKSFSELHAAEDDPLHGAVHSMGEPG